LWKMVPDFSRKDAFPRAVHRMAIQCVRRRGENAIRLAMTDTNMPHFTDRFREL
jgi:hypothetical protein